MSFIQAYSSEMTMPNRSLSEGICGCEGGIKDSWCATCLSSEQDMTKLARGKRTIVNHCLDSCTRDSRSRNLSFIDRDRFTGTSRCERLEYARDHHLKPSLTLFLDWVENCYRTAPSMLSQVVLRLAPLGVRRWLWKRSRLSSQFDPTS